MFAKLLDQLHRKVTVTKIYDQLDGVVRQGVLDNVPTICKYQKIDGKLIYRLSETFKCMEFNYFVRKKKLAQQMTMENERYTNRRVSQPKSFKRCVAKF